MFLPNPASMSAAFERDPELLDFALRNRVLPATPVELLALLKAVAYGWQQQRLAESAEQLLAEAQQLFERLAVFLEHHAAVGHELGRAVARYNDSVASYERRLRPALERAGERGIRLEERPQPEAIAQAPRRAAAAEGPPSAAGKEPGGDADALGSTGSDDRLPPGRSSPG
jgi:DNA recombination protein RmuC